LCCFCLLTLSACGALSLPNSGNAQWRSQRSDVLVLVLTVGVFFVVVAFAYLPMLWAIILPF
jgi:hypothetical protein